MTFLIESELIYKVNNCFLMEKMQFGSLIGLTYNSYYQSNKDPVLSGRSFL